MRFRELSSAVVGCWFASAGNLLAIVVILQSQGMLDDFDGLWAEVLMIPCAAVGLLLALSNWLKGNQSRAATVAMVLSLPFAVYVSCILVMVFWIGGPVRFGVTLMMFAIPVWIIARTGRRPSSSRKEEITE